MARPDDDHPAGLREPTRLPRPRPGVGVAVTVLLALAALAGLWAAFTGVGPARLDAAVLHESVESRTDPLTAAAVVVTHLGSTAAMAVLAVAAVVVIGTLVVLAWPRRTPSVRAAIVAAATLWVGAVGLTRIYLGVHWFSDVIAG